MKRERDSSTEEFELLSRTVKPLLLSQWLAEDTSSTVTAGGHVKSVYRMTEAKSKQSALVSIGVLQFLD